MVTCSPQQAALDATWEYSWTHRGQIQLHQVRAISKQWEKWRQQILSNAGNGWCNITRRCSGEDNYYNAGLVLNSLSGFDRVKFEYIIQLAEHSAGQGAQCNCLFVLFSGLPVTQKAWSGCSLQRTGGTLLAGSEGQAIHSQRSADPTQLWLYFRRCRAKPSMLLTCLQRITKKKNQLD